MRKLLLFFLITLLLVPVSFAERYNYQIINSNDGYKQGISFEKIEWLPNYRVIRPIEWPSKFGMRLDKTFFDRDEIYLYASDPTGPQGATVPFYRLTFYAGKNNWVYGDRRDFSVYPALAWKPHMQKSVGNMVNEELLYYPGIEEFRAIGLIATQKDESGKPGIYVRGIGFVGGSNGSTDEQIKDGIRLGLKDLLAYANSPAAKAAQIVDSAKRASKGAAEKPADVPPEAAALTLSAKATGLMGEVALTWNDFSKNGRRATKFLAKAVGETPANPIITAWVDDSVGSRPNLYTFKGLLDGVKYTFSVTAYDALLQELAKSNEVAVMPGFFIQARPTGNSGEVELSWSRVAGANMYHVECQRPGTSVLASEIVNATTEETFTKKLNGLGSQQVECYVNAYAPGPNKIAESDHVQVTPFGSESITDAWYCGPETTDDAELKRHLQESELRFNYGSGEKVALCMQFKPAYQGKDISLKIFLDGADQLWQIIGTQKMGAEVYRIVFPVSGSPDSEKDGQKVYGHAAFSAGKHFLYLQGTFADSTVVPAEFDVWPVDSSGKRIEFEVLREDTVAPKPQFFIRQGPSELAVSTNGSYSLKSEQFSLVFKGLGGSGSVYFGAGNAAAKVNAGAKVATIDREDLVSGKTIDYEGEKLGLPTNNEKFFHIQISASGAPEGCTEKNGEVYDCEAAIERIDNVKLGENAEEIMVAIAVFGDFDADRKLSESEFARFTVSISKKGAEPAGSLLEVLGRIGQKFIEQLFPEPKNAE